MVTFIEIIEGANEGSRFKIEEGLTLGRTRADIIVKDPKISGTHAEIQLDGKGQLVLVDRDSANGIHISGRRVKKVALLPGVIFEVGRTQFRVVTVEEELAIDFSRIITWRSILQDRLNRGNSGYESKNISINSIAPVLRLQFIQGIQADEEVILGYGPRMAGAESLDIELWEEEAPAKAFELVPGPGVVQLNVLAPGKVTVNKKVVTSEVLRDGDLIGVGNTLIKVSYL